MVKWDRHLFKKIGVGPTSVSTFKFPFYRFVGADPCVRPFLFSLIRIIRAHTRVRPYGIKGGETPRPLN